MTATRQHPGMLSFVLPLLRMPVPVFDESVRGLHAEDYTLLQYGHVHLYRHGWARDRLAGDLRALGYTVFSADLAESVDADAVRGCIIGAVPDWPGDYGRTTWPGFTDGLADHLLSPRREMVMLVLSGFDQAAARPETEVMVLLDLLACIRRWHLLFGRRLICLVGADKPDLDLSPLGAEHVRWNRHEFGSSRSRHAVTFSRQPRMYAKSIGATNSVHHRPTHRHQRTGSGRARHAPMMSGFP